MFRNYLLIAIAILAALIIYRFNNVDKIGKERQTPQTKTHYEETTAISTNDLSFSKVALNHAVDRPKRWALEGNVTNASKHELKSIVFQVTLRDCEKIGNFDTCHIVGQENAQAIDLHIPPGQTRAFKSSAFEFSNLPKDILAACVKQGGNAGSEAPKACAPVRQFNWVVWEIRAGS